MSEEWKIDEFPDLMDNSYSGLNQSKGPYTDPAPESKIVNSIIFTVSCTLISFYSQSGC